MSDLTDFLLARTAEDEATALYEYGRDDRDLPEPYSTLGGAFPDRVLAECEAKRRMMELHAEPHKWCGGEVFLDPDWPECDTLRLLALPYADHPDYREEWRP